MGKLHSTRMYRGETTRIVFTRPDRVVFVPQDMHIADANAFHEHNNIIMLTFN